jgi:hypothetical protein
MKRIEMAVAGLSFAAAIAVSIPSIALADEGARLASQYAAWAGGRANAQALVNGLRTGGPVTLVTVSRDNTKSLAGFTAQTTLTTEEISAALAGAKSSLTRLGIREPSADQIQAALIGGEVALPNGKTRLVQGTVTLRAEPTVSPVAAR